MNTEIGVSGGTPGGGATVTLFDSFVAFRGTILAALDASRLHFAVENDQAGALRASKSEDGSTWDQIVADIAVAASAADAISTQEFAIDRYRYFRLQWVNGATPQGTWRPTLIMVCGDRAAST